MTVRISILVSGLIALFCAFTLACSQATGLSSAPDLNPREPIFCHDSLNKNSKVLWGFYEVSINPDLMTAEIIPLRGVEFTANVTMFMQPPKTTTHLLGIKIDVGASDLDSGFVVCDVSLRHPFPSFNLYRGFDVFGIVMGNGSIALDHDSTALVASSADLTLLNADGYTRWFNPSEFSPHETIFGYIQGKLAPKGFVPTATVNAYKYFADELGAEDELILNPANRGTFSPSSVNTREYRLQFPMNAGQPVYKFAYAIEANWYEPDASGAPQYPLSSFPLSANLSEPYMLKLSDNGSTAWFVNESNKGGSLKLAVEVFDWQAPKNPEGVNGELSALWIEGEVLDNPVNVLPIAEVLAGGVTSSVFQFEISDLSLTHSGDNEIWVIAESANPSTYEPQIGGNTSPWKWPDAPLAAYLRTKVKVSNVQPQNVPEVISIDPSKGDVNTVVNATVYGLKFEDGAQVELRQSGVPTPFVVYASGESWVNSTQINCSLNLTGAPLGMYDVAVINPNMLEGVLKNGFEVILKNVIYVDDSNTSGVEDGTQANPFNTVQEGLAAASAGWQVWVDDSGVAYGGPFTLKANVILKSVNWASNDGDNTATLALSPPSASAVVTCASNSTIDGFEIRDSTSTGIIVNGVSSTIKNCIVTNINGGGPLYGIRILNSPATLIDNCVVSEMLVSNNYTTAHGISMSNSPCKIENTVVKEIKKSGFYGSYAGIYAVGCNPQGANRLDIRRCKVHAVYPTGGDLPGSYNPTFGINIESSNQAEIYNNIIYNITGGNYDNVYGVSISGSTGVQFVNNVIYNISKMVYYGIAYGLNLNTCTSVDIRNCIISRIHKGSQGYYVTAYGVNSDAGSTYTFQYNDVFDCATANYSGLTPGIGCISLDPKYVSPGVDFHLQAGSPCINTGDPNIKDPDNSQSDMGAYGGPGGNW